MRSGLFTVALLLFSTTPSLAAPQPITDVQLLTREEVASLETRDALFDDASELWKRKGGGGGGGKGGSGGSSSSGSSSGSGKGGSSSSSGGSTSSGSSGSSAGKGSSSSSAGGSTKQGSGVQPSYGGGKYYGGGASSPYSAGGRSPLGIAPVFLGVAALSVFPGLWLYGAYSYPYGHPYTFHNRTAHKNNTNTTTTRRDTVYAELVSLVIRQDDSTGANETKPVDCLCAAYAECGCDDNGDTTFLDSLIGDGTYSALNQSLINVVDINGTSTIVLNGTLENGTTIAGGTEDANGNTTTTDSNSAASATATAFLHASGYWVMVALVGCTVYFV